jgi:hypothetical protein
MGKVDLRYIEERQHWMSAIPGLVAELNVGLMGLAGQGVAQPIY